MATTTPTTPTTPIARWKDLCFDALDREAQARFWAAVIGLEVTVSPRNVSIDGATPRHTVWINGVDRPHVTKNRVHPDVDCASVEDLIALGATIVTPRGPATHDRWTVLADPEGNEFCAFEREPDRLPAYRLHGLGIDCVDPAGLAAWWGEVLGAEVAADADGVHTLTGVAVDERMTLDFAPVPESRTVPNRVHWDLTAGPGAVETLLGWGATYLWDSGGLTVLADPEGNEFCVAERTEPLG